MRGKLGKTGMAFLALTLCLAVVGAGFAYFSDVETAGVHDIKAGTLNLNVGDNDPSTVHITIDNIAPGWHDYTTYAYTVKNTGSVSGKLSVEVTHIVNNENGIQEPEKGAPDEDGTDFGELGAKLDQFVSIGGPPLVTADGIGSTQWGQLNRLCGYYEWPEYVSEGSVTWYPTAPEAKILDPGEETEFILRLDLPESVGNCVQSDSVEFDLIFHLDQVQPYVDQSNDTSTP